MCQTGTCDDCLRNVAILSGLNGRNGVDGNRIQIGTGAPNSGDFNDDDYYIDRNSPLNFYHKVAGAWVFIGRLQGLDGNGFLLSESTLISSADLLNSATSPVIVTQTPPVGYAIIPVSVVGSLHFNTTPYVCPYGMMVSYANTSNTLIAAWISAVITSSSDCVGNAPVSPQLNIPTNTPLAVRPNTSGTLTSGDSDFLVRVVYYITPA